MQFQDYTMLYQNLWQQHEMHLQKGCRAYVILLLCITAAKEEEEEAKEQWQGPTAAKEQQQDDGERYDAVAKIKLA